MEHLLGELRIWLPSSSLQGEGYVRKLINMRKDDRKSVNIVPFGGGGGGFQNFSRSCSLSV